MACFVWIDCEMTGLLDSDELLEVACILTNANLEIVAECEPVVIGKTKERLDQMNDWCKEHHSRSGLVDACLLSKVTIEEAEDKILRFVQQYIPEEKVGILAGNSVHADRVFLAREMPRLISHVHYRIVDVSSLKELVRRWHPNEVAPAKKNCHRALEDIRESINELCFYKRRFFE